MKCALMNRRTFLTATSSFLAAAALPRSAKAGKARLKIGVTDWNLRLAGKLEAVALARSLGFDGVQVSIGRKPVDGRMPLDNASLQQQYVAEARERRIPIDGTCLDILHVNYLTNDKLGEKWVADGIRVTRALGTCVMLLPFFGKGALETRQEMDYVGDVLRNLAPEAEKAGVILGLEDTISAVDNLRILERAKSPAVLVYYDIGNSTVRGFDVLREIRQIGAKRICQFHFKDNPHYLGEGTIDLSAVLHAISDIEYQGFANLETDSPSHSIEADMRRNLTYVRKLMAEAKL
jgi:L-ribulose-5-phosphate 3-epimerase